MKKLFFIIILMFGFVSYSFAAVVWTTVSTPGLGNPKNNILYPGPVKNGYFYIGTYNSTNGGQLFRTSDGVTFSLINSDGFGIGFANNEIKPFQDLFNNEIYTFTQNGTSGFEIWKSSTGDTGTWVNIETNGMNYANTTKVDGSVIFNNELYIGFSTNFSSTGYLYKNSDGSTNWTEVTITNFFPSIIAPDGNYNGWLYVGCYSAAPVLKRYNGSIWETITTNGFGDINNTEEIRPAYKGFSGYIYAAVVNYSGAQLWRSSTGAAGTWNKVFDFHTIDSNNTKIVSFSIPGDNYLYFSTYNGKTGTEVWRTAGGTSDFEQINIDGFGGNVSGATNISCNLSHNLFKGLMFAGVKPTTGGALLYSTPISISTNGLGETIDEAVRTADDLHILGSAEQEYLGAFVPDGNNPTTPLTLQLENISSGSLSFKIFTLTGETIFDGSVSCDANGNFTLNIPSDIASGTYIIKVEGPNFSFTKKFAVLR